MKRLKLVGFGIGLLLFWLGAAPSAVVADDGEFWDAAVAARIRQTRKMDRTRFSTQVGGALLMGRDLSDGIDVQRVRLLAEVSFLGFRLDRYSRLMALHGWIGAGVEQMDAVSLDGGYAKLTAFHHLSSGSVSMGIFTVSRELARAETFSVQARSFEYCAGGGLKAFMIGLCTNALGYEYRQYDRYEDYHGFYVAGLGLQMGLLFRPRGKVSIETSVKGEFGVSWPRQQDMEAGAETALHINSRRVPVKIALKSGYAYYREDGKKNDLSFDYFFVSLLLGVRF